MKRLGQVVRVRDGRECVDVKCKSAPLAEQLVGKLAFIREANPEWSNGDVLLRAIQELDWARRFRARVRRVPRYGRERR